MKKVILSLLIASAFCTIYAQNVVTDTVSTGQNYVNQVWYRLESGQKTNRVATDWDIAFKTNVQSATIFINDAIGTQLWKYPKGDETTFGNIDTTGLNSWVESYNSPEKWEDGGAFNDYKSSDPMDYGWGIYNVSNHNLTANSVFVIKLSTGDYRQIQIEKLVSTSGIYIFKYAHLDGSHVVTDTLDKNDFSHKNFAYYSLQNQQELNPEPNRNDWDLLFTKYTAFIPYNNDTMAYPATGVLANEDVYISQVNNVDVNAYDDYEGHTPDSVKNIIGYDWKSFDRNNNEYSVADSTVYFVQDRTGNIWKVVFIRFGGSANGNYIFTKEKMKTTGVYDAHQLLARITLYPNPVSNNHVIVAYSLENGNAPVHFAIYDAMGRMIFQKEGQGQYGMNTLTIPVNQWAKGLYYFSMTVNNQKVTQKLIVK